MSNRGTETEFELTTIDRLEREAYDYVHGSDLSRESHVDVVLLDDLRESLSKRYPELPPEAISDAVTRFSRPEGVDTIRRNLHFHTMLTRGIDDLRVEFDDGHIDHHHVYAVDWDSPENNRFIVSNQVPIDGKNDRRPDIVLFVNGLPLVIFELKNPYSEKPTVEEALTQIEHYRNDIPQLFEFNAITVVSDGPTTLHGMWTSDKEWFAPWKSIDGIEVEANTTGSMKTLIEGLFKKDRLLSYVRHFILFEVSGAAITKKGAKYHQFFAVHTAADRAAVAFTDDDDKRLGVIWHTTGSGKSLSMVFLVGMLRGRLQNPTFLIQVDRTDLDQQLHDQFVDARALVGEVKHADNVDDLRSMLRTEGGEIVISTIQKFRLKKDGGETEHEVLSNSSKVIVIADEAHRSQYGFSQGFARYLAEALPNAKRLGFTGTPVSFAGADTVDVFGNVIHTYDIKQSQQDKATVKIYYHPQLVKVRLQNADAIDPDLDDLVDGKQLDNLERKKSQWAALAAAAGAADRVRDLAKDLLAHFNERQEGLRGKAMVVCMTRANCVSLYDALTALDGCPEVKVVMTGDITKDPEDWNKAGHISTKKARDAIKLRMKDPDDPLKIVIVCDMWLTGTDIPCLHTLYIDKPMKGHNVIQAISRVNRVFRDKDHGMIVDYIGIGDDLRKATVTYTKGGGRGDPAPDVSEAAKPVFYECLEAVRELLPKDVDYGNWRSLSRIDLEDRYSFVYGNLTGYDDLPQQFMTAELRLSHAFLLVRHLEECRPHADEVIFYQCVRSQIKKTQPGRGAEREVEKAVRDLIDDSVVSDGVVDIFAVSGIPDADISILDDQFLQTFKNKPHENLRLKLLERLLRDAIKNRESKNLAKARSFRELLEETINKYHNRVLDAADVIKTMIQIRQEMEADEKRASELGLESDELAFYDAIESNYTKIYDVEFLCELIHDVVASIKRNVKVDWTSAHRDDVMAAVRTAVKRVLRKRGVKAEDLEPFVGVIMEQAVALFRNWPAAA